MVRKVQNFWTAYLRPHELAEHDHLVHTVQQLRPEKAL